MALQWEGLASSTAAEIYMQAHELMSYLRHYTLEKFVNDLSMTFILSLNVRNCETFFVTSTIFIKTLSLPCRKKEMEN